MAGLLFVPLPFMGFDFQHFEFAIPPSVLSRALRQYRLGKWMRLPMSEGRFQFQIIDETVTITRERKKISEIICTCGKKMPCLHAAVALLALEEFPFETVGSERSPNDRDKVLKRRFNALQKQIQQGKNPLEQIKLKVTDLVTLLALYLSLNGENEPDLNVPDEKKKIERELLARFKKGFDENEVMALLEAVQLSLKSEKLRSENGWSFLIPLLLNFSVPPDVLRELLALLSRRSLHYFHTSGADYRAISQLQLHLALAWPEKSDWKKLEGPETLALAHFLITSGNYKKGINLLRNYLERIRTTRNHPQPAMIQYAIEQSHCADDKAAEIYFTEASLKYALQADPSVLKHLRDLCSREEYLAILLRLAEDTPADWLEKKKDLVLALGDRQLLQQFLRQPLRFNSLLQVLQALLPLVPPATSDLLVKAIPDALRESPRREWQEHILSQCKPYLTKLDEVQRREVVIRVVAVLGERSHVADWFKAML